MTHNFWQTTTVAARDAQHWRVANHMLVYADGSMRLVSDRDAEHLLAIIRAATAAQRRSMTAVLVNMAFLDEALEASENSELFAMSIPLAVGGPVAQSGCAVARSVDGVVALRMFGGSAQIWDSGPEVVHAASRNARRAALRHLLTDCTGHETQTTSAAPSEQAGKGLLEWRGRTEHWDGSQLQSVCLELAAKARSQQMMQR
jgi:hypothetical protein